MQAQTDNAKEAGPPSGNARNDTFVIRHSVPIIELGKMTRRKILMADITDERGLHMIYSNKADIGAYVPPDNEEGADQKLSLEEMIEGRTTASEERPEDVLKGIICHLLKDISELNAFGPLASNALMFLTSKLLEKNKIGCPKEKIDTWIEVDCRQLLRDLGLKIDPKIVDDMTFEEKAKEQSRASDCYFNGVKRLMRTLGSLEAISLDFYDLHKFWARVYLIDTGVTYGKGMIHLRMGATYSEYIMDARNYFIRMPKNIYRIPSRNINASAMAKKMAAHWCNYANQRMGRGDRLKVSTLLKECPAIESIETIRKQELSWRHHIKKEFELALKAMMDISQGTPFLTSWRYCGKNGVELTTEEADFKSYEEWESVNVSFRIGTAPIFGKKIKEPKKKRRKKKATTTAPVKTTLINAADIEFDPNDV